MIVAVVQLGGLLVLGCLGMLSPATVYLVMGVACARGVFGLVHRQQKAVSFCARTDRGGLAPQLAVRQVDPGKLSAGLRDAVDPSLDPVQDAGGSGDRRAGRLHVAGGTGEHVCHRHRQRPDAEGCQRVLLRRREGTSPRALGHRSPLRVVVGAFCLLLALTGDRLAILFFSSKYAGTGPILLLLALGVLANTVGITAGNGLWAIERPSANFAADLCVLGLTLVLAFRLVHPYGVVGVAIATLAGTVVGSLGEMRDPAAVHPFDFLRRRIVRTTNSHEPFFLQFVQHHGAGSVRTPAGRCRRPPDAWAHLPFERPAGSRSGMLRGGGNRRPELYRIHVGTLPCGRLSSHSGREGGQSAPAPRVFPGSPGRLWFGYVWLSLVWVERLQGSNVREAVQISMPLLLAIAGSMFVRTTSQLRTLLRAYGWAIVPLTLSLVAIRLGVVQALGVNPPRVLGLTAALVGCVFLSRLRIAAGFRCWAGAPALLDRRFPAAEWPPPRCLSCRSIHPLYRHLLASGGGGSLVGLAIALFYTPIFQERFFAEGEGTLGDVVEGNFLSFGRFETWPELWEEAWRHPVLGGGVGSARTSCRKSMRT